MTSLGGKVLGRPEKQMLRRSSCRSRDCGGGPLAYREPPPSAVSAFRQSKQTPALPRLRRVSASLNRPEPVPQL